MLVGVGEEALGVGEFVAVCVQLDVAVLDGETVDDGTLDGVIVGVMVEVGGDPVGVWVIVGDAEYVGEIVRVLVAV